MNKQLDKIRKRVLFRLKSFDNTPQRLYDELDFIKENGGADALLLVSDCIRFLRSEGIHVGPGGEEATCSLLCYGLGITDVNPLVWSLPFEPFLTMFSESAAINIYAGHGAYEKVREFLDRQSGITVSSGSGIGNGMTINFLDDDKFLSLKLFIHELSTMDVMGQLQKECSKRLNLLELDEQTLSFIKAAERRLVPVFDSQCMVDAIQRMDPECFSDLYLIAALKDGTLRKNLDTIISRKNTRSVPSTGIAEVDRILMESYGMLVYKEQKAQIENILCRLPESSKTDAIEKMLKDKSGNLVLKGHAIALAMFAVENAWFAERNREKYLSTREKAIMERIREHRESREVKNPAST